MGYMIIAAIIGLIAALLVFFALKLLFKNNWIGGFIRGFIGLTFLAIGITVALSAYDILSYKAITKETPVATLGFEKLGEQHFRVKFASLQDSDQKTLELHGDQWQMDARILRWKGLAKSLRARPGYRLERLSGRYFSIEDEQSSKRSAHSLATSDAMDFWAVIRKADGLVPLVDANYGSAAYLPMADGALFQVSIGFSGLTAQPLNPAAEAVVESWR